MKWLRYSLLIGWSFIFIPIVTLVALIYAIDCTGMDEDKQRTYLSESGFYATLQDDLVHEVVTQTFPQADSALEQSLRLVFRQIVDDLVTEAWVETQFASIHEDLWSYLRGEQDLMLAIDMQDRKEAFIGAWQEKWKTWADQAGIPSAGPSLLAVMERQIPDQIQLSGFFLEEEELKRMRSAYDIYSMLLPIGIVAVIVIMGIGFLMAWDRKAGLLWLAVSLWISGIMLLLIGRANHLFRFIWEEVNLGQEMQEYEPAYRQGLEHMMKDIGSEATRMAGILIAVGVFAMVLRSFIQRRRA
ncbi:hypothetical protein [Marinicrinis sediminis]|uniref:DUF1461 domain-containing protein n=1 Tax=Marinicrinis sediminis TaxID=1652465 RepID=A0ABW5REF5_9BACL